MNNQRFLEFCEILSPVFQYPLVSLRFANIKSVDKRFLKTFTLHALPGSFLTVLNLIPLTGPVDFKEIPGKGLGTVARQPFKKGELVMVRLETTKLLKKIATHKKGKWLLKTSNEEN